VTVASTATVIGKLPQAIAVLVASPRRSVALRSTVRSYRTTRIGGMNAVGLVALLVPARSGRTNAVGLVASMAHISELHWAVHRIVYIALKGERIVSAAHDLSANLGVPETTDDLTTANLGVSKVRARGRLLDRTVVLAATIARISFSARRTCLLDRRTSGAINMPVVATTAVTKRIVTIAAIRTGTVTLNTVAAISRRRLLGRSLIASPPTRLVVSIGGSLTATVASATTISTRSVTLTAVATNNFSTVATTTALTP
jgi:hypothetical protein